MAVFLQKNLKKFVIFKVYHFFSGIKRINVWSFNQPSVHKFVEV